MMNTHMDTLPPGTQLQLMYLQERLEKISPGNFVEIGPGTGEITHLLLSNGWKGRSYDLEEKTIASLKIRFSDEIKDMRYMPINEDFLTHSTSDEKVDLVISCMVMEHLRDHEQFTFMYQSKCILKESGMMIGLVPSSPLHWGIEDDIAGHRRRYTRKTLKELIHGTGWSLRKMAGLTFPISNFLLPLSSFLVNRVERSKLAMSTIERTKQSGRRQVKFKTHFPVGLGLFLNKYTMYPFHYLQKLFANNESALVIYFEATPNVKSEGNND